MLWDIIYNFYITYIFGGWDSSDSLVSASLGGITDTSDNTAYDVTTGNLYFFNGLWSDNGGQQYPFSMSLGNYLSLIATIITIVAILLFCIFIIKKIIGIMFRLATGSSAF